ncbi:MAG TPA: Rieske 2Fe-2S domain-containing protein [Candidatus Norongarragalinales archaeon]|jgi:nitrite reductase/ring-hydroxylating ferredoxin subunit|nr:Rieske 2Fe-2S domain-containing protein [Candidatus Norongarragalinales archaeon]
MADFQKACSATDVKMGGLKKVTVGGKPIVLANVGGKIYALGDTCTHLSCSLSEGSLEGKVLRCHCHGSQFDATSGAVIRGPAKQPETSFDVKIEGGNVLVKV